MTFVRPRARVLELSTTAGNGPYALAGSPDGSYNTFASFLSIGDTVYASVVEPGVAFWTGIVTYSAANQITLTTVEETKGTFGNGTKEIFAAHLASRAMYAEDASGAIVTGGTSTAYTVASYRGYDTLTRLHNQVIAFTPHVSNGQTTTLNVDGLGAKPLRPRPGYELQSNALIAGTPYTALYNHIDGVFYLHAFGGSDAPGIPLGAGIDYWGATTPSTSFAFPAGQAISRSVYAALFALMGTTYGVGDGSTTFNLPDKTGKVSAMKEAAATLLTVAGSGVDGGVMGSKGGAEKQTLLTANLPPYTPAGTNAASAVNVPNGALAGVPVGVQGGGTYNNVQFAGSSALTGTAAAQSFTGTPQGGTSAPVKTLPPLIVCNYIMRVL